MPWAVVLCATARNRQLGCYVAALIANSSVKTASPAAKNHSLRPLIPAKTASPTDTAIHKKNVPGEYDHQNTQRGTKLSFEYGSEIATKQTEDIMTLIMPSIGEKIALPRTALLGVSMHKMLRLASLVCPRYFQRRTVAVEISRLDSLTP